MKNHVSRGHSFIEWVRKNNSNNAMQESKICIIKNIKDPSRRQQDFKHITR
jgi:hypothetical protein